MGKENQSALFVYLPPKTLNWVVSKDENGDFWDRWMISDELDMILEIIAREEGISPEELGESKMALCPLEELEEKTFGWYWKPDSPHPNP